MGFAGAGDGDEQVGAGDHAEVAVTGFPGVDKEGRCAGAREGRRHLACDVAGLAHAGDDHPAAAVQAELAGLVEARVQPRDQAGNRGRLDFQHAPAPRAEIWQVAAHVLLLNFFCSGVQSHGLGL